MENKINELAGIIKKTKDHIKTEEAVKTAYVLPFLEALEYDSRNPLEVVPEQTLDHGMKKGEKVDYAIKNGDETLFIIECKMLGSKLGFQQASQLFRYFSVDAVRFGLLTDGVRYLFFSDLKKENKMDDRPFFEFNVLDFTPDHFQELKKFAKSAFNTAAILATADKLKYNNALLVEFENLYNHPSDEFVRVLCSQVYEGSITSAVKEKFRPLVKKSFADFIRLRVHERLRSAMESTESEKESALDGSVEFDDNARKTILRLYYGKTKKSVIFMEDGKEVRYPIGNISDLDQYQKTILAVIQTFLPSVSKSPDFAV